MKNKFDGFNCKLEIVEEEICEFEDVKIKII